MNEKFRMIQLGRCRSESVFSFHDNKIDIENENESKWSIVRHRLPDILALSKTYKPKNVRTQLILLISLMNRQANQLRRLSSFDFNQNLSHFPANVIVNIGNRNRIISLKRIPIEQMIHVDVDGLEFSIPTRQFIIAISRGYAHDAAAKYCPPAISDMLINLSKTKVADDGRQYRRALIKKRVGKMLFFSLFILIGGMILSMFVSATSTIFKLGSFDHKNQSMPITSFSSSADIDEHWESR
jgi:hypothetical protein